MDLSHLKRIGLTTIEGITPQPQKTQGQHSACAGQPTAVCICAGQSNMVGRGKPCELPAIVLEKAASSFVSYDHDRNFAEKANEPHRAVKDWTPLTADAQYSYGGQCLHFGPEFGIAQQFDEPAYFIKFAMGSTTLHTDWRPDGKYFRECISFVKSALAKVPQPAEIKAFFWLQGESDSTGNAQNVNAYEQNLVDFLTSVRRELGNIPVIASQVDFHNHGSSKRPKKLGKVNEAIAQACAREEMQPATCSRLEGEMSTFEDGHLDSAALLQIGANMGSAYLNLRASLQC
jgi:hypothetical protein